MTDACLQVYEWRVQKMEAFRLQQELAEAARLDAQQARMIREEKEKMHREQQKAKVFLCFTTSCIYMICCFVFLYVWMADSRPQWCGFASYVVIYFALCSLQFTLIDTVSVECHAWTKDKNGRLRFKS